MAKKNEKKTEKKTTSRPSSGGASGDKSSTPSTKVSSSSSTPTRTRQAEVTTTNKDSKGNEVSKTTTLNNDGKTSSSKSGSTTKKTTKSDKITSTWDKLTNDTDGDGKTSFGEFAGNTGNAIVDGVKGIGDSIVDGIKSVGSAFGGKDYDGDGKTSFGEWGRNLGESISKGIGGKDFNEDGRYSLGETIKGGVDRVQSAFGGVDYDNDGTINTGETLRGMSEESSFGENLKAFLGGNNVKKDSFWDAATTGLGIAGDAAATALNPMNVNTLRVADNTVDFWNGLSNKPITNETTNTTQESPTSSVFGPKTNNNKASNNNASYDQYLLWLQLNPGKSFEEYQQAMSDKRIKDFVVRGMGNNRALNNALKVNSALDIKEKTKNFSTVKWTPQGIQY